MAPPSPAPKPEQVAAFFQKHRTGLVTIVFTDLADSSALLQQLGDQAGATFLKQRREIIRDTLRALPEAEEIETAGDSFLLVFAKPSDAVRFALLAQARLRKFSEESDLSVQERIGIHLGEVVISEGETELKAKDLYGIQLTAASRVMSLAQGGQTLLTRGVFDSARQVLKGEDIPGLGQLNWASHGLYLLKGVEEPLEVCEVTEAGTGELQPPKTSEKAQRQVRPGEEPVLGWRPAVGQEVPNTPWVLEEKLGEGGFGEVWRARHPKMKENRVFKFCFHADRVRSLKRELTLFKVLKERVGEHPSIVRLHEVYLDEPPYYLEEEFVDGKDLATWCQKHGGVENIRLEMKLEIVAQAADALQAAHDSAIIHRDVKPGNILVTGTGSGPSSVRVKLTDFGIGQVTSTEALAGVTRGGFTETILSSSSSSKTGTHLYMAPELLAGNPASTRSDIYSLGVVLFQMLAGDFRRPVTADWHKAVEDRLLRDDLERCFAWDADDRFAGATQLGKNLRNHDERLQDLHQQEQLRQEREDLTRRLRQRRKVTTGVACIATALLLIGIALVYGLRQADQQRHRAEAFLYAADMNLAFRAWESRDFGEAETLLRRHFSEPSEENLCRWEWRFLWGLLRGDQEVTLRTKGGEVISVDFLSDERLVAGIMSVEPNRVELWDLPSGRILKSFATERVSDISVSPDSELIGVAHWSTNVTLLDGRSLTRRHVLHQADRATKIEFSPDGRHLATSGGNHVHVWDIVQTNQVFTFPASALGFADPAFSPGGRLLACISADGRVSIRDVQTGDQVCLLGTPRGNHDLWFSANGKTVAAAYWDGTLSLLDIDTCQETVVTNYNTALRAGAMSPDGRFEVVAGRDGFLRVWDTREGQEIASLQGHRKLVGGVAFAPDGERFASGSKDSTIRIWSPRVPTNRPVARFALGRDSVHVLSSGGRFLAAQHGEDPITITDLETQRTIGDVSIPDGAKLRAVSFDGTIVASELEDGQVALSSTTGPSEGWNLGPPQDALTRLEFSAGGLFLAAVNGDYIVRVWDLRSRRVTLTLPPGPEPRGRELSALAFSAREDILVAGYNSGFVNVFDLARDGARKCFRPHVHVVSGVAISADGATLATSSLDETVVLWDLATLKPRRSFSGAPGGFSAVTFSPGGQRVAAVSNESQLIRVWELRYGQQVASFRREEIASSRVDFLPGGDTLVVGLDRSRVEVWRAPSFAEIEAAEKAQRQAQTD